MTVLFPTSHVDSEEGAGKEDREAAVEDANRFPDRALGGGALGVITARSCQPDNKKSKDSPSLF